MAIDARISPKTDANLLTVWHCYLSLNSDYDTIIVRYVYIIMRYTLKNHGTIWHWKLVPSCTHNTVQSDHNDRGSRDRDRAIPNISCCRSRSQLRSRLEWRDRAIASVTVIVITTVSVIARSRSANWITWPTYYINMLRHEGHEYVGSVSQRRVMYENTELTS